MPSDRPLAIEAIEPFPRGAFVHFTHKLCEGLTAHAGPIRLVGNEHFELSDLDRSYELLTPFAMERDDLLGGGRAGRFRRVGALVSRASLLAEFCGQYQRAVRQIVRRKPDYVVIGTVFRHPFIPLFLRQLRRGGVRCVQICHELQMREEQQRLSSRALFWMNRNVYDHFDGVLFLSAAQQARFQAQHPDFPGNRQAVMAIGNAEVFEELAGPQSPREVATRYGLDADRPVVLFFGRIRPDKGVEDLIDALQLVLNGLDADEVRPQVLLAGHCRPAFRARLDERIARHGLQGDVTIYSGYVPNEDVWPLMQHASVVTFPYRSASQSAALQAAFTCGRPIVVTAAGGLPEVVDDGRTGLVVSPSSPNELHQALKRLLSDPEAAAQLGHNARTEAITTYSWDRVASDMTAALRSFAD